MSRMSWAKNKWRRQGGQILILLKALAAQNLPSPTELVLKTDLVWLLHCLWSRFWRLLHCLWSIKVLTAFALLMINQGFDGFCTAYDQGFDGYWTAYDQGFDGYCTAYDQSFDGYCTAYDQGFDGYVWSIFHHWITLHSDLDVITRNEVQLTFLMNFFWSMGKSSDGSYLRLWQLLEGRLVTIRHHLLVPWAMLL